MGEFNYRRMNFTNCHFNNNHAKFGNIIYNLSKDLLPNLGISNLNDISTIPSYFEKDINSNSIDDISILSGESIPEGIMYKLYDGFHNQMYFPHKTSNLQFEDLIFFNVETNDPYNAIAIGQTQEYCWDEVCKFPPVTVIGNPGIYTLSLKIKSFVITQNANLIVIKKEYVLVLIYVIVVTLILKDNFAMNL